MVTSSDIYMIIFFSFHANRFLCISAKTAEGCTCVRAHVTDSENPSKRVSTFTANIMQNLLTSLIYVYTNKCLMYKCFFLITTPVSPFRGELYNASSTPPAVTVCIIVYKYIPRSRD